jgi:hypothetical protein
MPCPFPDPPTAPTPTPQPSPEEIMRQQEEKLKAKYGDLKPKQKLIHKVSIGPVYDFIVESKRIYQRAITHPIYPY